MKVSWTGKEQASRSKRQWCIELGTSVRSTFQLCGPTCIRGARTCRKHDTLKYVDGFEAETTKNVCTRVAVADR